jgi:hypothetical protein
MNESNVIDTLRDELKERRYIMLFNVPLLSFEHQSRNCGSFFLGITHDVPIDYLSTAKLV